jgi:MoaA/NifB/PqqE/SkfB family radical SAM enzyme
MRFKGGYLGVLTDELRRRGPVWGAKKLAKYVALRGSLLTDRAWFGPFVVELSLTYRCECNCYMCGLPLRHAAGQQTLDVGDFERLVGTLAAMGSEVISLGGGEPLLFDGLDRLVATISGRGLACKLNTSGGPLTGSLARDLVQAGLSAVAISLDGASAEVHDNLRSRPGAFEQARKAAEMFAEARARSGRRPRISICSVLSDRNLDQALPICQITGSWPVDHIGFMPVQSSSGVDYCAADPERLRAVLQSAAGQPRVDCSPAYLRLLTNESRRNRCGAGHLTCVVDCLGLVYPCEAWYAEGRSVGDLYETDFRTLWYGRRYRELRRQLRHCRECTWDCQKELDAIFGL